MPRQKNKALSEALIASFLALGAASGGNTLERAAAFMRGLLTDSDVDLDPGARRLIASMISAAEKDD